MVYKRYYSPFEEQRMHSPNRQRQQASEVITPKKADPPEHPCEQDRKPVQKASRFDGGASFPFGFLNRIGNDDLLLIGILILLLTEEKEHRDVPLILTIGFLLLAEYIDGD